MTLADVLARLDGVRPSGEGFTARCPAHEDREASLSVTEGTKGATVVLHCFAGCSSNAGSAGSHSSFVHWTRASGPCTRVGANPGCMRTP